MASYTRVVRGCVAASALGLASLAFAQAPTANDLVGTWNITMTSPVGSHPTTMAIREEGGQLTGTVDGLPGATPVVVKTSDAGVTFAFSVDYQGGPVSVVMAGKIAGSDIKGSVDYADGAAAGDFSGSKAGAAASLAGVWAISGDGGDGFSFALTQEGTAVGGVLRTPDGNELPLKGTLENGRLALTVMSDSASGTIDGTYEAGVLKGRYDISGNAGSWSAVRKP